MNEKPILMCGEMVKAVLEGRKTQTRRIVKPQPAKVVQRTIGGFYRYDYFQELTPDECSVKWESPYGLNGDRLWVRETWGVGTRPDPNSGWVDGIEYRADELFLEGQDDLPLHVITTPEGISLGDYEPRWRPSIFMPRWACRIVLEIVNVRMERVQNITEDDAAAEGMPHSWRDESGESEAASEYRKLWNKLNAGRGFSWDVNPWVWVIEFKRIGEGNGIDLSAEG